MFDVNINPYKVLFVHFVYVFMLLDYVDIIDGIVSYMKKQVGPSSLALHSEADLDAFINGFDASVVGELSSCYYQYCDYWKNK